VTYNAAGSRIASIDYNGNLFIWNSGNGGILHHQQLPTAAGYSLAYAPDGKQLAIATRDKRLLLLAVPSWSQ
jgi:WD40 repeat protein